MKKSLTTPIDFLSTLASMGRSAKVSISQYQVKGPKGIEQSVAQQFLDELQQNNTQGVINIIEEQGDHLATLQGSYFLPPLLTAGKHNNILLMNHLVNKGADPYKAVLHPQFAKLPYQAKHYLKSLCEFSQQVLACLRLH